LKIVFSQFKRLHKMIDSVQNKEKLGFLCIGGNLDELSNLRVKPESFPQSSFKITLMAI